MARTIQTARVFYNYYSLTRKNEVKNTSLFALLPEKQQIIQSDKINLASKDSGKNEEEEESRPPDVVSVETDGILFTSPTPSPHLYTSLHSQDTFRLLEILPARDETVQCVLHTRILSKSMRSYEALSYCWDTDGSNLAKIQIVCNGHRIMIHHNLYDALHTLRRGNEARLLWVDAICIDQSNTTEKNHQVGMMGSIFSSALRVLIWIGRPQTEEEILSSSCDEAFEGFFGICAIMNKWLVHNGRDDLVATFSAISDDVSTTSLGGNKTNENSTTLGVSNIALEEILQLFRSRWFSRIWVLQEVVLAASAKVFWGRYEINWDWIGLVAAITRANFSGYYSPQDWSIPSGLMNAYLMYRLSSSQTCLPPLGFSFVQLLQLTRQFQSTQEHDRIYGLLGLEMTDSVSAKIQPSYDSDISGVYENIARLILEMDDSLSFLSSVRPTSAQTPSWIPRWGEAMYSSLRPTHAHWEFSCASKATREFRYSNTNSELELRGIIIDSVSDRVKLSSPLIRDLEDCPYDEEIDEDALESIIDKVGGDLKGFAMTLTCGMDWNGYPISSVDTHVADFFSALISGDLDVDMTDYFLPGPKSGEPMPHALDVAEIERIAELGDKHRFMDSARDISINRTMFKTSAARIGMGPTEAMKSGDLICAFLGADVPFLIRPEGDGYRLLGECYVYDIMHGEILDQLADPDSKGELKEEWIKLI